jgi:hypothetical protein
MSSIPDELSEFVKAALARGLPRADVDAVLRKAGWTEEQTRSALAAFSDLEFPIPVPRPQPYVDAREAFMYLLLFSALYVSAYHLGSLLFDIINTALLIRPTRRSPPFARSRWPSDRGSSSRFRCSVRVVARGARYRRRSEQAPPGIRRWLTH